MTSFPTALASTLPELPGGVHSNARPNKARLLTPAISQFSMFDLRSLVCLFSTISVGGRQQHLALGQERGGRVGVARGVPIPEFYTEVFSATT